ncbi:oxidoreductase [Streptosporangium violaceochromogenes]|nr:oxidoreductase [Streptosporangium violaceochromogenes]
MYVVLITGGTSGIGRALVSEYAGRGATVVTCGRDTRALDDLRAEGVDSLQVDLADHAGIRRLLHHVRKTYGRLDTLVNCAATHHAFDPAHPAADGPLLDISVDLLAPAHLSLGALPLLTASPSPVIVNVTSIAGVVPKGRAPGYSAGKAGLIAFTDALRHALQGSGVKVVDLMPPPIETPMAAYLNVGKTAPGDFARLAVDRIERGDQVIRFGRNRWAGALHRIATRLAALLVR